MRVLSMASQKPAGKVHLWSRRGRNRFDDNGHWERTTVRRAALPKVGDGFRWNPRAQSTLMKRRDFLRLGATAAGGYALSLVDPLPTLAKAASRGKVDVVSGNVSMSSHMVDPGTTLRFDPTKREQTWGLNFMRRV